MKRNIIEEKATFYELDWDTKYFGVSSAKMILHKSLTLNEWKKFKKKFIKYKFVSIENRNSDPINAQLIGTSTSAFLVDTNIQYLMHLDQPSNMPENVIIKQNLKKNDQIIEMAKFPYSKFEEDKELFLRGGDKVYHEWLINSFEKKDKHFALYKDENGEIKGFLLHSYSNKKCVIELIAVAKNAIKGGIGSGLIEAVKKNAFQKGAYQVKVGTQVRNINAINFYQKSGFKQVGSHQIYHLWN